MALLNPYLNFDGKTKEAFEFYRSVFGGEFTTLQLMKDVPGMDNLSEEEKNRVMHVSLPVQENVLMGSDIMPSMGHTLTEGNNFHLSVNPSSEAETEKLFNALSAGGKVTMPLEKTFWNAYFGMCIDKFGIRWMVNFDYGHNS